MRENNNLQQRIISSWSRTNFSKSQIVFPKDTEEVISIIGQAKLNRKKIIGRGAGRSYGDQALNNGHIVVEMVKMDQIIDWNPAAGVIKLQSGITYENVLRVSLKDGWTLPVIPGTRYVTMGGALSNNVHGKNSYAVGNFGEWVREFEIILASSERFVCSEKNNSDLFFAVIGGSGLFGIVTEITLQLIRVPSVYLAVKKTTASSLDKLINELDKVSKENDFAIAQVDCFPQGKDLGRGTIHAGSFISVDFDDKNIDLIQNISPNMFGIIPKKLIPIIGKYFLNDFTMRLVSLLKYHLDKKTVSSKPYIQDIFNFTFLLDGISNWIKIFRHGLFEYEPLIPKEKTRTVITELIKLTHKYDMPAYLSAIKIHRQDNFLISYSMDGYSFALDIPRRPKNKERQDKLFREMNKIVIEASGIVYLAKDANLTRYEFRQMYKNVEKFKELKKKYDPEEIFCSDMYRRLFQENK